MKVYIDKLMGGVARDKDDAGSSGLPDGYTLEQYIEEVIANSYIDFNQIINNGDLSEFNDAIQNILTAIQNLTYQDGDEITAEMIANYQSIFDQLNNLYTELNDIEGIDQDFLTYFNNLLTSFQTAINNLVLGDNLTTVQIDELNNLMNDFSTILQQFLGQNGDAYNSLYEFIENVVNQIYGDSLSADTVLISGSITWKTGLTFAASNLVYRIFGDLFTTPAQEITLAAADPANPRIDVFVVDRFGNLSVITGQPAADPVKPTVGYNQLEITQANINAGAGVPSNITVEPIYDEENPEEWAVTSESDPNITVNHTDLTAPGSGAKHISVALDIPDATGNSPRHYIGEHYQGGKIFWLAPDGKSGLIAALSDQGTERYETLKDGEPYTTGANATAIGTGRANSDLLEAHLHNAARYAVRLTKAYIKDGYTDWYLPSRDELAAMYYRKNLIGGFAASNYWSSSESDSDWRRAWNIDFTSGEHKHYKKDHIFSVRAIRSFDDSQQDFDIPVLEYAPESTKLTFTAPATKAIDGGYLTFWLSTSLPWLNDTALLIESWNGATKNGAALLRAVNPFGFDSTAGGYQQVSIPVSAFGANAQKVTAFTFRLINTWKNGTTLNIDLVQLQSNSEETAVELIEDIAFEYRDVSEVGQVYTLDISASNDFKIVGLVAKCDAGTLTATIKINGVAVTGLGADVTNAIQTFLATGANLVSKGDLITLEITAHDTAAELIGKLQISRT